MLFFFFCVTYGVRTARPHNPNKLEYRVLISCKIRAVGEQSDVDKLSAIHKPVPLPNFLTVYYQNYPYLLLVL